MGGNHSAAVQQQSFKPYEKAQQRKLETKDTALSGWVLPPPLSTACLSWTEAVLSH